MWAFQSMVRHKLNTPMHGMASCMELLTTQPLEDVAPEELAELIGWTQDAMQRLEMSVASVLHHTQATELVQWGDSVSLQDVTEMVEQVAMSIGLSSVTYHSLDTLADDSVRISRPALECIFNELLENTKKFHPRQDPCVTVTAELADTSAGLRAVRFTVMDDGITLSPAQLGKMWEPYFQGERTFTGEVSGMGLGLSQVRTILWQIGGRCAATNRTDQSGLMVEVVLPLLA